MVRRRSVMRESLGSNHGTAALPVSLSPDCNGCSLTMVVVARRFAGCAHLALQAVQYARLSALRRIKITGVLHSNEAGQDVVYCSNIFERYEKCPIEHADYDSNNMSLLEFAMLFEPYYAKRQDNNEKCVDQNESSEQQTRRRLITLNDNSKMVNRNTPAVVRVPYFIVANDPDNYYYSLLLQYLPYRSESELMKDYDIPKAAFLARESNLRQTSTLMDILRERDRQIENAFNQVHAFEILDQLPLQADIEAEDVETEQNMSDGQFQTAQRAMNIGQKEERRACDPTSMLTLVNGAIVHITEIIWPCFRRAQMYETHIPSVRVDFANEGIHIIHPKSVQFPAKFSYGTAEPRIALDYDGIYLEPKLFAAGQAYIALSRIRSLDGLQIKELDCSKLSGIKPCNTEALVGITYDYLSIALGRYRYCYRTKQPHPFVQRQWTLPIHQTRLGLLRSILSFLFHYSNSLLSAVGSLVHTKGSGFDSRQDHLGPSVVRNMTDTANVQKVFLGNFHFLLPCITSLDHRKASFTIFPQRADERLLAATRRNLKTFQVRQHFQR
ncbi:hypothetical protein PR048_009562 [Dryococelus australis]|uniref:Uncharacterized protein n=1 Tax=Dryococelus australis TaxID=614101 RepID=A0ABQ9I078_9NEOP|nr:hypothetical protein PR048_009562 [Dryococelus australis]